MDGAELLQLERAGWRLTRDGSTSTAQFAWDDPEDPDSGWEVLVLHTAGHGARFTLIPLEAGLTERSPGDASKLHQVLTETIGLLARWQGELPED